MNTNIVSALDLQNMMDAGAQFVGRNYTVFSTQFPGVYMSELGMTDIIMAYGKEWAVQNGKTATWVRWQLPSAIMASDAIADERVG